MKKIITHLSNLVSCQSISPKSQGAIEYTADVLKGLGFKVDIQIFGPYKSLANPPTTKNSDKDTYNLYARYTKSNDISIYSSQRETGVNICFAGHVDVVPPGDISSWQSDPFTLTIDSNKLYGRGTVDMKGSIACMLAAVADFLQNYNLKEGNSISFLLTSDEEGNADYGTQKMLEYIVNQYQLVDKQGQEGHKHVLSDLIDVVILGEPTSEHTIGDTIKIGRRGSVNFQLKINGTQGHVAYPEQAANPNTILIKILHDLINYRFDDGNQYFARTNLEITSIDVNNIVTNVIPQQANARFNVRFNNFHTATTVVDIIKMIIEKHTKDYQLEYKSSAESFLQSPDITTGSPNYYTEIKKIITDQLGIKSQFSTGGGTSDARFIHKYFPVLEIGLKQNMAHKINEYTEIDDLENLYKIYCQILLKTLS